MARPTSGRNRDAFVKMAATLMVRSASVGQLELATGLGAYAIRPWLNTLHKNGVVYRSEKRDHTIFWRWQARPFEMQDQF